MEGLLGEKCRRHKQHTALFDGGLTNGLLQLIIMSEVIIIIMSEVSNQNNLQRWPLEAPLRNGSCSEAWDSFLNAFCG